MNHRSSLRPRLASAVLVTAALVAALSLSPVFAKGAGDSEKPQGLTAVERAQLYELLLSSQARTLRLLADVPPELLDKPPAEGKWSAAGVLEHLGRAEVAVRGAIEKMLAGQPHPQWQELKQPSLEQLVATASDRSQKFDAPEPLVPEGKMPSEKLLAHFLAERATTLELVRTVDRPLHQFAAKAPIGVELDASLWIGLIGAHNERHNDQIAEIRDALGLAEVE